jgi:Polyketide cyclase / dehydrase and lipid transport
MITPILVTLAVVLFLLVVVIALQPSEFRVTRSAAIAAPPAVVFGHVNELQAWQAWSPWAKLDPAAKNTYEGPAAGTGASMAWAGNQKVGEGRMTITESRPHEFIRFRLEFLKPWKATNTAEFSFKPDGSQTVVSWTMLGTNNFMSKAFGLVMNCDKMIGGCFEKGLAQMKAVAESGAGRPS